MQPAAAETSINWDDKPRALPLDVQNYVNNNAREMYDQVQWIAGSARSADVSASMILISGCQDNQLSFDGSFNGQFTGKLLQVWNNGSFQGSYPRVSPGHSQPDAAGANTQLLPDWHL